VSILGPEYLEDQLAGGPSHDPRASSTLQQETTLAQNFEHSTHPANADFPSVPVTPSQALRAKHQHLQSISTLASQFGAKIADVSENSVIVEMTAKTSRVEAFLGLLKPFGILESARTGLMAMPRTPIHALTEEEDASVEAGGPIDASLLPPG
jgi:acetolactate synthase-1/3 small subunit